MNDLSNGIPFENDSSFNNSEDLKRAAAKRAEFGTGPSSLEAKPIAPVFPFCSYVSCVGIAIVIMNEDEKLWEQKIVYCRCSTTVER